MARLTVTKGLDYLYMHFPDVMNPKLGLKEIYNILADQTDAGGA